MVPFSEIVATAAGILLRIGALVLLCGGLLAAIEAIRVRSRVPALIGCLLEALLCALLFYALLDGTYYAEWLPTPRVYWPRIVTLAYAAPWRTILLAELLLAAALGLTLFGLNRFRQRSVSAASIKETMDLLPAGICFGDRTGAVRHANLKMTRYAFEATGKRLTDVNALWETLERLGEDRNGQRLVTAADGTALLFASNETDLDGEPFRALSAVDVTERHRITLALREMHRKLLDLRMRMKAWSADAAEYAMQKEILTARIAVHDEVGHALLRGRYYLEHPENADEAALLGLLVRTNDTLLYEAEHPDDAEHDPVAAALRAARGIGVAVHLSGDDPKEAHVRALLGQAIRECAANTFKHAEGDAIEAETAADEAAVTVTITNNGRPPEGEITEAGGLISLRAALERAGGTMTVESAPAFRLTLRIPRRNRPK